MLIVCRLCERFSLRGSCCGAGPGPLTNAREPETLQPPLASMEVRHLWAS